MPSWMSLISWNQDCHEKYQQPQICKWYHSNGRKWRGTKSLLMRSKEQSEKANLKSNIQKTKITAPSPITSWQIEGEKVEAMMDFPFLGSKITEDSDCSHEIKRCLLLGRKAVINLGSVLKSKDFTLLTKVHIAKAMVFPVVVHGCESWTIKKVEHWKIDAFKSWFWRRLEIPLDCKEINPEYSLERLMLKVKL